MENVNQLRRRKISADGLVDIICSQCGEVICRMPYTGFSTISKCVWCERGIAKPLSPKEELLKEIFSETEEMSIEEKAKSKSIFGNILELAVNTVRALGFKRKPLAEEIDPSKVNYETIDSESSRKIAKRKERQPIFAKNRKEK